MSTLLTSLYAVRYSFLAEDFALCFPVQDFQKHGGVFYLQTQVLEYERMECWLRSCPRKPENKD